MILCLGTTPAAQRVMRFRRLTLDAVNRAIATLDGAAGKSINVAKVLHALGEPALATGFLGGDRGEFIRETLRSRNLPAEFVTVEPRTRQCVTLIDESGGTVTELVEESQPVAPEAYAQLDDLLERHLPLARALVMSGTLTPGGPVDYYQRWTQRAGAAGLLTVVDAQGSPLIEALAAGPGLVKPNRAELAATVERELTDEMAVVGAGFELLDLGARRVVITAGARPTLALEGNQCWRITPPPLDALNPIGSGDAFTAGLVARLLRGDDLGEACRWGAAAGAANALTPLAGEVEPDQVQALAREVTVVSLHR